MTPYDMPAPDPTRHQPSSAGASTLHDEGLPLGGSLSCVLPDDPALLPSEVRRLVRPTNPKATPKAGAIDAVMAGPTPPATGVTASAAQQFPHRPTKPRPAGSPNGTTAYPHSQSATVSGANTSMGSHHPTTGIGSLSDTDRDSYREAILAIDPARGGAAVAVADYLHTRQVTVSYAKALLLAVDLLRHETSSACATLATLLTDGWEQGLGDALNAARSL